MCDDCIGELEYYGDVLRNRRFEAHYEWWKLQQLLKDLHWYNFEIYCRDWNEPWHTSRLDSASTLETWTFYESVGEMRSSYFTGILADAFTVPAAILIGEVADARAAYEEACECSTDHVTYAPGGEAYTALCESQTAFSDSQCNRCQPCDEQ